MSAYHDDFNAMLEAKRRTHRDNFRRNDFASVVTLYTTDCIYMPPGYGVLQGREEICKYYQDLFSDDYMSVDMTADEVLQTGDYAIERGTWMLRSSDGVVTQSGNHISIWKCIDGDWLLYRLVENINPDY